VVYALYSAARSWPDLFTFQWPITSFSNRVIWILMLTINATTFIRAFSTKRGLPAASVFGAPYIASARTLAQALLAAACADNEALAPSASDRSDGET
jgi:hypothetical protein